MELGDALLVAAAVMTLALFGVLYTMLPPTSVELQTAAQTGEQASSQGK